MGRAVESPGNSNAWLLSSAAVLLRALIWFCSTLLHTLLPCMRSVCVCVYNEYGAEARNSEADSTYYTQMAV